MKRKVLPILLLLLTVVFSIVFIKNDMVSSSVDKTDIAVLKEMHKNYLENSPFKAQSHLSRKERKSLGLPPNAYYEDLYEMTLDPRTGRPMPERLMELKQKLKTERILKRSSGSDGSTPWISRGPSNQGGRTRAIMFDPNDIGNSDPNDDYNRVFAGGVSGGLWVNEDITQINSSWTLVPGIDANISVNVLISDPNDSNTFYIGSGESYVSGDTVGRGIWKSTDGGATWTNILGGYEGFAVAEDGSDGFVLGIFYINDLVARNVNGTTELYAGVASAIYGPASNPRNYHGLAEMGLYKSINGGTSWTKFDIKHNDGSFKNPSDIEIDINNNIWLTTTANSFGNRGGDIYKSSDGNNFELVTTIPGNNVRRTELEVSSLDPNKFWVAVNNNGANLFRTEDGFTNIIEMPEPNDVDEDIPAGDYTRGQAFYNLPIEVDSKDKLFVGGIDWFSTNNNAATWAQISKWSNNNLLSSLTVPTVHADQHAIIFRPGTDSKEVVIANDGGVYYSANIASAATDANAIKPRNRDYVTTQFYYGSIQEKGARNGDDIAGGTQDNGTQFLINAANSGTNSFVQRFGGDGAYTEIHRDGNYAIVSFTRNFHLYTNYPSFSTSYAITTDENEDENPYGSFINQAALDQNLNILYSNASIGSTIQIERTSDFMPDDSGPINSFLSNSIFDSTPDAIKVSPFTTNSTTLFLGLRNSKLIKVENANAISQTWTDISGPNFLGSISDIEFGKSEDEIFVSFHNYGVTSLYYTGDGGLSWRSIEGNLPDLPVKCILQNPISPEELIIGTELGIWITNDYTVNNPVWEQAFNGMSDVTVLDLDLRASDNTILASTYGRGLFTGEFTANSLSVNNERDQLKRVKVFPTISDGNISISADRNYGNSKIEVFNINGKRMFKSVIDLNEQLNFLKLDLASGMYFVNIAVDNYTETKKIIIK